MSHLFSIPVRVKIEPGGLLNADWIIPSEAEQALQRHYPYPAVTLHKLFQCRLHKHGFVRTWDWILVVLPGRYPIGGHLVQARQGPKSNLVCMDHHLAAPFSLPPRCHGYADPRPFPMERRPVMNPWVSAFWVATKGLLRAAGHYSGGWLEGLANEMEKVPPTGHWIYLAEPPPPGEIDRLVRHNHENYVECFNRDHGPCWQWSPGNGFAIDQLLPAIAEEANGDQRIRCICRYLDQHPEDARGWGLLAQAFHDQGQPYRSSVAANRALALAPDWLHARYQLGRELFIRHCFDEAAFQFRQILALAPLDIGAISALTYCYSRLQRHDDAIRAMEHLVELDPANENAINNLGMWYHEWKGELEKALATFMKGLEIAPTNWSLLNNCGYTMAKLGDLDIARAYCQAACMFNRTPDTLDSLGFVHLRLGEFRLAIGFFKLGLAMNPAHAPSLEHLAEAEARLAVQESAGTFKDAKA